MAVGAWLETMGANSAQGSVHVFGQSPCPTFTLAPDRLSRGFSGIPYQQSVTVSGGAGPYQFVLVGGALPPGISLSPSGLLSGTPATPGSYNFTLGAIELSAPCSGSRAYTITIASCPTLTLDPPILPDGASGIAYSHTLQVFGGRPPYSFIAKSALPAGMSLSANGVLSGTPTQAGYFPFTLQINDE